jgi:hypothetical protein
MNIEEGKFIGTIGVVLGRKLDRVACVTQIQEVDTLNHSAVGNV